MTKVKELICLAQASDGKIYQVALNKRETDVVLYAIKDLHDGQIKLYDDEIEGIKFTRS